MSDAAGTPRARPQSSERSQSGSLAPLQCQLRSIAAAEIPELAAQLAALHARLFNPGWQAAAFHDLLARHAATSLVATTIAPAPKIAPPTTLDGRASAGFIIARIAADEAEILTLGVARELQNHGLGGRLLKALLNRLKAQGANRLVLEVAAANAPAIALYQCHGFQQVGRRRNYYAGAGGKAADALVLALDL